MQQVCAGGSFPCGRIQNRFSGYRRHFEEWAQHNIEIKVDYEIRHQDDEYLSFVVRGYENWSSAYNESRYYNLDLRTGKEVTLKDLLGDNYETLANESIREQITEREKAGEVFFAEDEGGFAGISENVKFYINNNHNPVIIFDKYEIANGAAGEIEFEISQNVLQETQQTAAEELTETASIETPEKAAAPAKEIGQPVEDVEQSSENYENNFAVDCKAAKEFAENVKNVTAKKDLEGLAELTSFPVYVGLPGIGPVETKEDFLNLGADAVFTEKLLKSVETADIDHLQPSMAGFSISDGGTSNINFGVVNGALAINGINY